MNTLIGKIVLFLGIVWLAFCTLVTIVLVLNPEIDPPKSYAVTMFLMIIIGLFYSMIKLADWMDWPKGSTPYLSIQIKRRDKDAET